ncbi:MAG: DNA polymerase III subunit alpha, partial [Chitinophagales bacterium]|nr:DNA polymerase III subunit alpha [Chitinophagales bacterium]
AYLKANYPAEYMAAVLSNNIGNIEKITFFMEECKRMDIKVKGPDINESDVKFSVNKKGEIRYALSAIKGVGESAVQIIVEERKANGPYKSIFDLTARCPQKAVNKKSLESLALAGAFDSFQNITRSMYLVPDSREMSGIDYAIQYGSKVQSMKQLRQFSLFGDSKEDMYAEPVLQKCEEWPLLLKLKKEKEVTGIYLSGHPLDDYRMEILYFTNCSLRNIEQNPNKDLKIAGIISNTQTRIAKNGNPFVIFTLEDYTGNYEFALFDTDFLKFKEFVTQEGALLLIEGRYQQAFSQSNYFKFKINKVELLSEVRKKLTESVCLFINVFNLSKNIIDHIEKICKNFSGTIPLKICVNNPTDAFRLKMISSFKIDLNAQFLSELKKIPELEIAINNAEPKDEVFLSLQHKLSENTEMAENDINELAPVD